MYFNTLLYSFMIKIIVTKAQVKHINIRMLKSTCVDECHNYQFAICFPGHCTKFLRLQTMLEKNTCFSNINFSTNFEEIAKVKEPELINNVTFSPINKPPKTLDTHEIYDFKSCLITGLQQSMYVDCVFVNAAHLAKAAVYDIPISRLDTMILMVYDTDIDPSTTKFIFCEKSGSRNLTKNGISVTFGDYYTPDSTMRFEILIEAVCEKEDCYGQMCEICGTTTELLPTTDISTSTGKTTHLSIKTTHSTGHTRDTSNITTIQITNIAESTTHGNKKSDVTSTSATTTQLSPTTDSSTSGDTTTTRLSTQTTYSSEHPGNTTNRPSPTKQSEKYTASTTHSNTTTDIASTSHISTLTKIFSAKTTSNATTPAISKRSTSHGFTTSSKRRSSTTLAKTTPYIKYIDSTIPSSRTVTTPTTVAYSNAKNSLSNPVIINEEVENSKNVNAWAITTTTVGIVEMIIIVLLIVYIRRLKIQKRTASSSQEFNSHL